ncbi:hypothetical protein A2U01_0051793, partial [Trifolium medium]|nr:hypothetical protein [Trifolium medium]
MSKAEVAVGQLHQLVLEQQSRPPVTVEQIRKLIQEERARRNRRRERPRERVHYDDEEGEWSDNSTWSWDSRSQPPQTDGVVKVSETAVATEKMRVLSMIAKDKCAHRSVVQPPSPWQNVVRP